MMKCRGDAATASERRCCATIKFLGCAGIAIATVCGLATTGPLGADLSKSSSTYGAW